jgi:FKBP-type peptidyl-prolyl cis-trans isomerase FkpA/FKBP-type peptidyl-prolyl cis-trans isomerase FklB
MRIKTVIAAAALAFVAACNDGDVMGEIEKGVARDAEHAQQAVAGSESFMATARAKPGVDVRPSGLVVEYVHRAANRSLPPPPEGSTVLVHYEGALADGTVFDSSIQRGQPAQFPLDQVIPGFSEALKLMHPGDAVIAYIPSELGYGARGQPPSIPPNAALQFRMQLLAYQTPDGRTVQARPE